MPNWVTNQIKIQGKNLDRLKTHFLENGDFDFNTLIPMPTDLEIECSSNAKVGLSLYVDSLGKELQTEFKSAYPNAICDITSIKFPDNKAELVELGKHVYNNYKQYGYGNWYDWRLDHWGCKWNACDGDHSDDYSIIYFNTPWDACYPVIAKLAEEYPDLEITYTFAEEQTGFYCGKLIYSGGKCIDEIIYDPYSKEAYEMSFELWGSDDDYMFDEMAGTYVYAEEE